MTQRVNIVMNGAPGDAAPLVAYTQRIMTALTLAEPRVEQRPCHAPAPSGETLMVRYRDVHAAGSLLPVHYWDRGTHAFVPSVLESVILSLRLLRDKANVTEEHVSRILMDDLYAGDMGFDAYEALLWRCSAAVSSLAALDAGHTYWQWALAYAEARHVLAAVGTMLGALAKPEHREEYLAVQLHGRVERQVRGIVGMRRRDLNQWQSAMEQLLSQAVPSNVLSFPWASSIVTPAAVGGECDRRFFINGC
jgi:hypothetical protein